ncbi:hypothetical protein JCM10908_005785 [Rhodotorula pacifica]|uniref:zinc finger MYND domain-containing protein n=1 Tax=Rhodotorula pacifica TaxID=1495444 RepID=UPI0031807757
MPALTGREQALRQECTWCEKPSESRCSACHIVPFCSAECQKLCWRVHKPICGADPAVFRQAPLTTREINALDGLKDRLYGGPTGIPFYTYVKGLCSREFSLHTWPAMRAFLVAPVNAPTVTVSDGVREMLICYARAHLSLYKFYPPDMCAERIWHFASSAVLACASTLLTKRVPTGPDDPTILTKLMAVSTRNLKGYLDETLSIAQAVNLLMEGRDSLPVATRKQYYTLLLMHCRQQKEAVQGAEVELAVKRSLLKVVENRVAEYEALFIAGKFGKMTE